MAPISEKKKIIGTLVPISALRSIHQSEKDFGTFESGIYFLDWLKRTHQSAWQILPLHQSQLEKGSATKHVPSPYKGYGIGLDPKYLTEASKVSSVSKVSRVSKVSKAFQDFVLDNQDWIQDYALFCALRDEFGTDDWRAWDAGLRTRNEKTLEFWRKKLGDEISIHIKTQWKLHESYELLKSKAKKLDIALIGDLPFYVTLQSPLVWAHQEIFQFERDGSLRFVSGCPDTPNAHFGRQIWGHPLFKWDGGERKKVIRFWKIRLKYLSILFDSIRFDHAKGLFDYGEIDLTDENSDKYKKGPGHVVFEELMKYGTSHGLSIFAEDSGENLSSLRSSLQRLNTPGIKIFRFALNEKTKKLNKEYAELSNYPVNTVAYTTTHDTETLLGYLQNLTASQKLLLSQATGVVYLPDDRQFAEEIKKGLINSPAERVIFSIQDWLSTTDRINIPGTEKEVNDSNWSYKLKIPVEYLPQI